MLPVVLNPRGAPAVLGEGVDASPSGNDCAVDEFLGPTAASNPHLTHEKDDGQENAVCDKGTAHDEVGSTLANVVALAESKRGNATEQHLRPRQNRHGLSDDRVERPDQFPNLAVEPLLPVQLEVQAEDNLGGERDLQNVREDGVYVTAHKLASAVGVAEEEAQYC
jgi:hypothetical protein